MDRAQADLNRVTELQKKNFATREEFDRVKAAYQTAAGRYAAQKADYERAKAALQQTQASASRTVIYAPMDGVVTYLGVELGEKVVGTAQMQGTEMMRIADLNTMNAWVEVDENDVAMIKLGDTAKINVDALRDQVFRGVVYEISHSAKVSAQGTQEEVVNFEVRIRMLDKDTKMRPGMSCNVDVETATHTNVVAVPIQSLTVREIEGLETAPDMKQGIVDRRAEAKNAKALATSRPPSVVWIAKNDVVQPRVVETGISDEGFIEITKGLKAGESIVTGPYAAVSKALKSGAKIRVEDAAARKRRLEQMRQQ
jgi:HlyD family secretion protein